MKARIFSIVKSALEDLNENLEYDSLREVNGKTTVFGGEEGIDSLSLVTLVVNLEREIEEQLQRTVVLTDERAMSQQRSPFGTVDSLVEFIAAQLEPQDG